MSEQLPDVFDECLWPGCTNFARGLFCGHHWALVPASISSELAIAVQNDDQPRWAAAYEVLKTRAAAAALTE